MDTQLLRLAEANRQLRTALSQCRELMDDLNETLRRGQEKGPP